MLFAFFAGEIREVVTQVAMIGQIERGAAFGDVVSVVNCLRHCGKELLHRLRWSEKEFAVRSPHTVRRLERRTVLDGDHRILEAMPASEVIVDVAGGDKWDIQSLGKLRQAVETSRIALDQVVLDLDEGIVVAEDVRKLIDDVVCLCRPLAINQASDFAVAATAEHDQSIGERGEVGRIKRWRARVVGGQVRRSGLPGACVRGPA